MAMKSLSLAAALAVAAQSHGSPIAAQTVSYGNARFGYWISYPADLLVPEPEADNGDGRAFHARHATGKMSVWGSNRDQDAEPMPIAIARSYEADCGPG